MASQLKWRCHATLIDKHAGFVLCSLKKREILEKEKKSALLFVAVSEFGGELSLNESILYLLSSGLSVSTTSFQELAQAGQSSLTIIFDNLLVVS